MTRLALLLLSGLTVVTAHATGASHITYSTVPGYFLQDDPATNASTFNYTATNFGLIDRPYDTDWLCRWTTGFWSYGSLTPWQRFACKVESLNLLSGPNVDYKVVWFGRHGEGYHNAAESYYGTPAWNCYWSEKDGNATVTWADAHLTPKGIAQAQIANRFWASEIATQKIPTPQSFYTSPLYRCLNTASITFTGLELSARHPFVPTVKELFREGISGHTCDRRSNKTFIQQSFPTYKIEQGFTEYDELWEALHGETAIDQGIRSKKVLDQVFSTDKHTYLSVTSHSGEIASILLVLGHQKFSLSTGAIIPVLIRAETVRGAAAPNATQPFTAISTCSTPPPLPTPTA